MLSVSNALQCFILSKSVATNIGRRNCDDIRAIIKVYTSPINLSQWESRPRHVTQPKARKNEGALFQAPMKSQETVCILQLVSSLGWLGRLWASTAALGVPGDVVAVFPDKIWHALALTGESWPLHILLMDCC